MKNDKNGNCFKLFSFQRRKGKSETFQYLWVRFFCFDKQLNLVAACYKNRGKR